MSNDASRELEARLRPAFDEEQIASAWQRIGDARSKRTRRRRQLRFAAIPVLTLGAAVAIMLVLRGPADEPPPLGAAGRTIEPGAELAAAVALDDGSQIALAPEAKLQVLTNDGRRFSTKLVRGAADFTVQPGGPRTWEIETALATVEVVGTAFRIEHAEHAVTVTVSHGIVLVRGERVRGRVQRLTAGEQLVVTDDRVADSSSAPRLPLAAPPPAVTADRDRQPATATVTVERGGDNRGGDARGAASRREPAVRPASPVVSPANAKRSLAEVLAEADQLRPRDPRAAATLIERALATHPDDSSAGVAAFALAKLYLESLNQPAKAAPLLRSIANRGSPHGLVEASRARLVEALANAGNAAAAREAFSDYERNHPQGRWLPALRKLVSR